jgi:single-strand selective monofunctional uracil DNA glycosylase
MIDATQRLRRRVKDLDFGDPISHVYNPIEYAMRPHHAYLRRYAAGPKRIIFLGMNPGPFGMAQTGVPFGEVRCVRDWLGIEAPVRRPEREHPKRPVQGFECARSEVSGARLWGALEAYYRRPERFFAHHFVANYCPLVFMESSGRNCTPDRLPAAERAPLFAACDQYLADLVRILQPEWVIGIGGFAAKRAQESLSGRKLRFGQILHPSPANPRANRDWKGEVRRQMIAMGLCESGGTRRG